MYRDSIWSGLVVVLDWNICEGELSKWGAMDLKSGNFGTQIQVIIPVST
tara:strand:+ start:51313 stop:51459 length:147 start_codon:yes stop_codon:yes gene_type:complete